MKPAGRLAKALVIAIGVVAAADARGGAPSAEAVQGALTEALSRPDGGLVAPGEHPPQVSRDGDVYRIRVPLPGLTAPPNAALDAITRLLESGAWAVTSLTLPPAGAMKMTGDRPGQLAFSIGQQRITATIDPSLTHASPFEAELRDVVLRTDDGERQSQQAIARYRLTGVVSGDGRRLNLQSQAATTNWRIDTRDAAGVASSGRIGAAAGSLTLEALDRGQAERLVAAGRGLALVAEPTQFRGLVDAFAGLLGRLEAEQTMRQIHFETGERSSGDIGLLRVGLSSAAEGNRLSAGLDLLIDDLELSAPAADVAPLIPRRIDIRPAVSGVPIDRLMQLLRDATGADADPSALWVEALALLADPQARVGIERLALAAGPATVTGSARVVLLADQTPAVEVHLVARGVDALLAEARANPKMKRILPLIFMAKGMARPLGDTLVWDVAVGDGGVTVNGVPVGQPSR